jgi:hypothetical protein
MTVTTPPRTIQARTTQADDDELTALALASDPDVVLDDDAECFWDVTGSADDPWLPEWYMPTPMTFLVIISFLTITMYGLCNTYGQLAFG